jgi:hypothetical protein
MLAKDWTLEVNTATAGATAPQWTRVNGLTKINEKTDDNTEDDSSFDGDGWGSDVVTQRKWSIEAEGRRKRTDSTTFAGDPGQEAIRTAARVVGFGAVVQVRWYRRDGAPDAYQGTATVSDFEKGGEVKDLEPFNFKLNGQGSPIEIPNPATNPPQSGSLAADNGKAVA